MGAPSPEAADSGLLAQLMLEKYEPIAITGIGLRVPGGATSAAEFAAFLRAGESGIGPVPPERWDADELYSPDPEKGKMRTRSGGFVGDIAGFDARFFGISPREANFIDPQHRLALETAWHALEDANIDPAPLRGGSGGVFLGVSSMDYSTEAIGTDPDDMDPHIGTGTAHSAASGRIAYFLGWRGPCISVDTACSSSLVALHLAAHALRRGECDIALAGGVNLTHHPNTHIIFSHAGMLSPDGTCKTFDDRADGYGRSEGCGIMVLRRLSDARADGSRIYALIRGSSVRQDGESSSLTAPNGIAQAAVMRAALASALLEPGEIQYVEAHGTGTPLGDPIEMAAIDAVFGPGRDGGDPVVVGSVKTNIGHMEPAAGAGGVIKTVLQLEEGTIYPHLHLEQPSRHIPWDSYSVRIPVAAEPWQGSPRLALVNSFGFAGTIASVVLEQPPPAAAVPSATGPEAAPAPVFTLSARTHPALRLQAQQYRQFLADHPETDLADLCFTASTGRAQLPARLAGVVRDHAALEALLDGFGEAASPGEDRGEPRVAFLCTGQGSQYPGMGAALYRRYPVFAEHVDECDALFAEHLGRSVRDVMLSEDPGSRELLSQTECTQPALFMLELATARLWMSWGVRPDILLGHSIGEVSAAAIAGLLSLPEAVRLTAARARAMQSVSAAGGMIAVTAPADEVAPLLEGYDDAGIAAVNGPQQCVISGGTASLAMITRQLAARGLDTRPLEVSHAFHSPLMAQAAAEFSAAIADIAFREPEIPFVSNLTGKVAGLAEAGTPGYWARHFCEPVRFADGIAAVTRRGRHAFIEIGPSAALTGMGRRCDGAAGHAWLASMRADGRDDEPVRAALARCYEAGVRIDWAAFHRGTAGGVSGRRRITLPGYAFDRRRHWLPPKRAAGGSARDLHPLLGEDASTPEQLAAGIREFRSTLGPGSPAELADHVVQGQVIFPGAGFVELLFAVQDAVLGETTRVIRDLLIHEPLFLADPAGTEVRTRLEPGPDGGQRAEIVSLVPGPDGAIVRTHVTAAFGPAPAAAAGPALAGVFDQVRKTVTELAGDPGTEPDIIAADDVYSEFADDGLPYGPQFARLRHVRRLPGGVACGEVHGLDTPPSRQLPATLLDAAMHMTAAVKPRPGLYVPVGFDAVELLKKPKGDLVTMVITRPAPPGADWDISADMVLAEGDRPVAVLAGVRAKRIGEAGGGRRMFHAPRWLRRSLGALPPAPAPGSERELVVAGRGAADLAPLAGQLAAAGLRLSFAAGPQDAMRLLRGTPAPAGLWWFWQSEPGLAGTARLRAESERNYRDLLTMLAGLESGELPRAARLELVTIGAQSLPGDEAGEHPSDGLAGASLSGFVQTLVNEYPAAQVGLIDLGSGPDGTDYAPLLAEWLAGEVSSGEFQVASRGASRYVRRLCHVRPAADSANFELSAGQSGQLSDLRTVPAADRAPAGDEICVGVRAAGLNFKDVLNALGLLREHAQQAGGAYQELPLGFEAAGTVLAAGPDAEFAPGDAVIVSYAGCMRRRVTVPSSAAVPMPPELSWAQAAALPTAYVTAWYALHDLARLKPGDRVLIHAAAGGVGQAAVRLAQLAGAEVYATASPAKWPLLRAQGVTHVMNSRTLGFADEIMDRTGGVGVTVVLNSLNKDFIPAGLSCLAQGGRFVELGKIGAWTTAEVHAARPDAEYHHFDLSELPGQGAAELNQRILRTVTGLVADGELGALPVTAYSLEEADEAFTLLSRGASTGKLVLDFGNPEAAAEPGAKPWPSLVRTDETYLITGGLGGLGRLAAARLAREGARSIVLASRRAIAPAELDGLAAELGPCVQLTACQADLARDEDVAALMARLAGLGRPVGGIIHAAGVIADAPVSGQTWDSIDTVFGPKVYGSWLLHQAATQLPGLRFLVGYSSSAAALGVAGQSNYAAANSFLDALMCWRAARGLPALSLNWGPWAEVGMAAGLTERQQRVLVNGGITFIQPADGSRALMLALAQPRPQLMVGEVAWDTYGALARENRALSQVMTGHRRGAAVDVDLAALTAMPRAEREAELRGIVAAMVADVLRFESAAEIGTGAAFLELGLDSLGAVELTNSLEAALGLPLPKSTIFDYPAVGQLAEYLAAALDPDPAAAAGVAAADAA